MVQVRLLERLLVETEDLKDKVVIGEPLCCYTDVEDCPMGKEL